MMILTRAISETTRSCSAIRSANEYPVSRGSVIGATDSDCVGVLDARLDKDMRNSSRDLFRNRGRRSRRQPGSALLGHHHDSATVLWSVKSKFPEPEYRSPL